MGWACVYDVENVFKNQEKGYFFALKYQENALVIPSVGVISLDAWMRFLIVVLAVIVIVVLAVLVIVVEFLKGYVNEYQEPLL